MVILSIAIVSVVLLALLAWLCLHPMTVSFTFDDGAKAHLTIAAPLLEKYGWRGAFNICTDFCEMNPASLTAEKLRILGMTEHPDLRLDWDDARELLRRGHEVYPHSCSHENLEARWNDGDHAVVRHEIHDSIAAYREHLGVLPRFFCCPHLGWTPEVRSLIRVEGVEMFNNWRPGFGGEEAAEMVTKDLCRYYYQGRRHVDLMFHGIVAREGGHRPFADEKVFEDILKAVASLAHDGRIKVVPYHVAHFGPSRFVRCLDWGTWLLNKAKRVIFKLIFRDKVPNTKWLA